MTFNTKHKTNNSDSTTILFDSEKEAGSAAKWLEYSKLHDSFAELLYYENRRSNRSDIWQLNYI